MLRDHRSDDFLAASVDSDGKGTRTFGRPCWNPQKRTGCVAIDLSSWILNSGEDNEKIKNI